MTAKTTLVGLLLFFNVTISQATDYYWVGNGGVWTDSLHWSLSSGGAVVPTTPNENDNVFFDANSFSLPGQVVQVLDDGTSEGVKFKTMDWRGVTNSPTFQIRAVSSPWITNSLTGSIYFEDEMVVDFHHAEFEMSSDVDFDLDTRGHYLGEDCWLAFNYDSYLGRPGYNVICSLLSDVNNAYVFINQGTLKTNAHSVSIQPEGYFWVRGDLSGATADITGSVIDVGGNLTIDSLNVLIDDNSTIIAHGRINTKTPYNFNHFVVSDSVTLTGSHTFTTLEINHGAELVLNGTQSVENFIAGGSNANPFRLTGGTITKNSGEVSVYGGYIKDNIATGGAVFNAYGSTSDGVVTGWNFIQNNPADSLALVAIYNSTNGANWTNNSNWLTGPIGTWSGVTIDGGRVTQLILGDTDATPPQVGNNLVGTIPAEIGDLDALQYLTLAGNQLSGTIPVEIGSMTNLKYLLLFSNQLTGSIPSSIGDLSNLIWFYVDENQLSGEIPSTIGNLSNLEVLSLWSNTLSGAIPSELGNLNSLNYMWMHQNQLTGSIPSTFGDLSALFELILHTNQLTGSIPASIGNLTNLYRLDFAVNQLTGAIPPEIGNLINLNYVDFSPNELTGAIPIELGNLTLLETLWLNNNNFTGSVPTQFVNLTNLQNLYLQGNQLDNLPDLSSLSLTTFNVSGNNFTFEDLEPNMAVTSIQYIPQNEPVDIEIDSLVAANTNISFSFPIGGASNQFTWYRDSTLLVDSVRNEIFIAQINRDNMGEYYAEVTNSVAPGLTFHSARKNVIAVADIEGKLLASSQGEPITNGTASLLLVTSANGYDTLSIQQVGSDGAYTFEKVRLADYIIVGFPDTLIYAEAIPTYYPGTDLWEEADTLFLQDNMSGIDIIAQFDKENPGGEGIVTGIFEEETGSNGGRVEARDRIQGAGVSMRRGRRTSRGEGIVYDLVAHTFTNENGEFNIKNLLPDTYRINFQYPGYPMDTLTDVDIVIGADAKTNKSVVEALVNDGKITVRQLVILGIDVSNNVKVMPFPNPTSDVIHVKWEHSTKEVQAMLFDASGAKVLERQLSTTDNIIDVKQLNRGTYILRVNSVDGTIKGLFRVIIE